MATILVIDDEAQVRDTVRSVLESAGHAVVEAEDGAAGIAHVTGGGIDLVLTDILMPGTEGIETIVEIRHRWPESRILAMSGASFVGRIDLLDSACQFGADGALTKPFRAADLLEEVARLLDRPAGDAASAARTAQLHRALRAANRWRAHGYAGR